VTDDWRLMGQENWLADRELQWAEWTAVREAWDHDHCAFCHAKIAALGADRSCLTAGYVTTDSATWICRACFDDFRSRFRWVLVDDRRQA
jgi:hypothetical protein